MTHYTGPSFKDPAEERAFWIFYARTMLREAKARRGQNVEFMLRGAARARLQAMSIDVKPQRDLFNERTQHNDR